MLKGKLFFREKDRKWIERKVTKLSGVTPDVSKEYLQGKFECTISQITELWGEKVHVVKLEKKIDE